MIEMLAKVMEVIMLQYIDVFNEHNVHLTFIQCYANYILIKCVLDSNIF